MFKASHGYYCCSPAVFYWVTMSFPYWTLSEWGKWCFWRAWLYNSGEPWGPASIPGWWSRRCSVFLGLVTRSSCSWHQESAKISPRATGKVLQSCFFISEMFMMLKIIIVFININNLQREKQSLQVLPIFHLNWQKSPALVDTFTWRTFCHVKCCFCFRWELLEH